MTAQILYLRDYKNRDEREAEINRACLAAVSEALGDQDMIVTDVVTRTNEADFAFSASSFTWRAHDTAPCEYVAPDGDCA